MIGVGSRTPPERPTTKSYATFGARYHTPLVDFADHDADQSFCLDNVGHPAPRGLVYCNQVLDGFFHDAIPCQSELPAAAMASRGTEAGLPSRPAP